MFQTECGVMLVVIQWRPEKMQSLDIQLGWKTADYQWLQLYISIQWFVKLQTIDSV